jgi:hypothetical protein
MVSSSVPLVDADGQSLPLEVALGAMGPMALITRPQGGVVHSGSCTQI